jgi:hypothetical protein
MFQEGDDPLAKRVFEDIARAEVEADQHAGDGVGEVVLAAGRNRSSRARCARPPGSLRF